MALLAILAVIILFWVLKRRRQLRLFKDLGIPGPEPEFLWGNLRQIQVNRIEVLNRWRQQYGNKFGIYFGAEPFLVILDPDMVHECFVKKAAIFQDRPKAFVEAEPFLSSLFQLKGAEWKRVRAVLNYSFSTRKIRELSAAANLCASRLVDGLTKARKSDGCVEMSRHALGLSLEFIAKSVLAWQVNCQEDPHDRNLEDMTHVCEEMEQAAINVAFAMPAVRTLVKWLYPFTKHARIFGKFMRHIRNVAESRRSGRSPKEADMLQIILDAQTEAPEKLSHVAPLQAKYLDDRYVASNVVIFLLAGFETTASALSFLTYLLAKHPGEANEILSEVEHLFPDKVGQQLDYDELRQLKRLDMVVKEGLRLYPPVPVTLTRRCAQDTTACGQVIPAGVNVIAFPWLIHRDPDLWPKPEEFLPERFAASNAQRYHPGAYMPFGLGPRMCIGKELGLLVLKSALIGLLQEFRLSWPDTTDGPLRGVSRAMTLVPADGVQIRIERRGA